MCGRMWWRAGGAAGRLWWRRGVGFRTGVGRGVGIGRGSSVGRWDRCRHRLPRHRLRRRRRVRRVRSGRGCWLNSLGSWTPAASRFATCPRSPPSSTPRWRPSIGTCSSSDGGLNRGRNRATTVLRLAPPIAGIKSGGSIANAQVQVTAGRRWAWGVCGGGPLMGTGSTNNQIRSLAPATSTSRQWVARVR